MISREQILKGLQKIAIRADAYTDSCDDDFIISLKLGMLREVKDLYDQLEIEHIDAELSTTPATPGAQIDRPRQAIEICVDRDGLTGGLQLSVDVVEGNGSGHGYRLIGPKFNGSSKPLLRHTLTESDALNLRGFLDEVFPTEPPR